ncbi:MAG TPA: glycine cleavage system protein H [Candidatus Limnocylindrales bacterium]|nr:glycine cleavage system protein H [Candidatus Limnocylindrales bacterium]
MTVILVLVTFLTFIVLDYAINRRKAVHTVPLKVPQAAEAGLNDDYAAGFLTPVNVSYHPGHSWVVRERKNVVRVGADEFAAALLGKVEHIELPKPGTWVRQGQTVLSFFRDGKKTGMVSPTEGEITEINEDVLQNPALLRDDPYGKGWLISMHVPDEESTTRNLLPKSLVLDWMRDAVERLYALQPAFAGAVAADGGRPAQDLLSGLPDADWAEITSEFFLTR